MSGGVRWQSALALTVAVLAGAVAFGWPLFLRPDGSASPLQAPMVFALVLPLVLAIVLAEFVGGNLDVKALAMLGVLAAVGSILRPLSAGTAGFELVFFLLILAGRVFGAGFGFALGAVTLFTSALITSGVGPWLPYQMFTAGWVGLSAPLARPLVRALGGEGRAAELVVLAALGALWGFAYGAIMNISFWPYATGPAAQYWVPGTSPSDTLRRYLAFYLLTSLAWDAFGAFGNVLLIVLFGAPVLRALRRFRDRMGFAYQPDGALES